MSYSSGDETDPSGTVTLADGEEVEIPRSDKINPIIGVVNARLNLALQQNRVYISEQEIETEISLATRNRTIESDDGAVATLFSGVSSINEDDTYAEMELETLDDVKEMRDACNLLLRYHGYEPSDKSAPDNDREGSASSNSQ